VFCRQEEKRRYKKVFISPTERFSTPSSLAIPSAESLGNVVILVQHVAVLGAELFNDKEEINVSNNESDSVAF
jgi:hypothetical protein